MLLNFHAQGDARQADVEARMYMYIYLLNRARDGVHVGFIEVV